jgi:hypothetical protein
MPRLLPAAAAAAAAAAKPWYDGKADAEMIGHWDNKGWKKDDPVDVALRPPRRTANCRSISASRRNQLIKLPKDATDEAGWKAVRERLGAPKEAKDYDFTGVKHGDGRELDAAFADEHARLAAQGRRVEGRRHRHRQVGHVKSRDDVDTAAKPTSAPPGSPPSAANLQKEWGTNFEFNRLTAMQGAKRLGVDEATVAKLEGDRLLQGHGDVPQGRRRHERGHVRRQQGRHQPDHPQRRGGAARGSQGRQGMVEAPARRRRRREARIRQPDATHPRSRGMTDISTDQPKPARPRRKAAKRAAAPAAPKKTSEFAGISAATCCTACTPERCVISTVGVCKHPGRTGDAGCGPVTIGNREAVKKILKRQQIAAST